MKNLIPLSLSLLFLTSSSSIFAQKDKRTPFPKVIYEGFQPYIEVDSQWVKLVSIENIPTDTFIKKAIDSEPRDWKFGFHRYLHYLMDDMGMKRGDSIQVSYEYRNQIVTKPFALKKENRDLATDYHNSIRTNNRIERRHYSEIPAHLNYLSRRLDGTKPKENWLSVPETIQDLEYLEWEITNHYSYADLSGFDYKLALDAIRIHLGEGISKRDFAYQLKILMANFGDGHSTLSFSRNILTKEERKWLPFKIIKQEDSFYAINSQEKTFFNKAYPKVVAINGININKLFNFAKELAPKSTPKFVDKKAIHYLQFTALLLKIAGEKNPEFAEVTFSDGMKTEQKTFPLDRYPQVPLLDYHRLKDTILDNNIGYLLFNEKMFGDDDFIAGLHQAMQKIKNTRGLIIDIRRNGGGSREPLQALLPYFITEAKVTNVARFRIDKDQDLNSSFGYLLERSAFPVDIDITRIPDPEDQAYFKNFKRTVEKFRQNFEPTVTVSNNKFSGYHYMVIQPNEQPDRYYYDKPVVVLIDEGCFSASDIFAAGIRQGDRVTLVGNTTGGGSGFTQRKKLPNADLTIRLSQMFSYQPSGDLYDGHGVVPDLKVEDTLEDKMGLSDSQLESAIRLFSVKE